MGDRARFEPMPPQSVGAVRRFDLGYNGARPPRALTRNAASAKLGIRSPHLVPLQEC
jgi:hypothetical protein